MKYLHGRVKCAIFARVIINHEAMNTKLTLTIEQTIIEKAKSYAKEKGRSLSDIIENYLKAITKEDKIEEELSPFINSLKGSFKVAESFDYKDELSKGLSEKYL